MRDDVRSLLEELEGHYSRKLPVLIQILELEKELHAALLKKGDFDFTEHSEKIDSLISSIDDTDLKISDLRTRLCRITGTDFSSFFRFISSRDENQFVSLHKMINRNMELLKDINALKQENISSMEKECSELKSQARELYIMQNIRIKGIRDPQSS